MPYCVLVCVCTLVKTRGREKEVKRGRYQVWMDCCLFLISQFVYVQSVGWNCTSTCSHRYVPYFLQTEAYFSQFPFSHPGLEILCLLMRSPVHSNGLQCRTIFSWLDWQACKWIPTYLVKYTCVVLRAIYRVLCHMWADSTREVCQHNNILPITYIVSDVYGGPVLPFCLEYSKHQLEEQTIRLSMLKNPSVDKLLVGAYLSSRAHRVQISSSDVGHFHLHKHISFVHSTTPITHIHNGTTSPSLDGVQCHESLLDREVCY